ncbi:hypothetical protein GCM10009693_20770 [Leucobacter chromiireducens subsp. chromiireducens]|uniref:Leucine-rich repeat domain-containing protein n=1 Tax=Leucobacter chromiireducens subsp. chromiireducens TaxID=660067 RepID=A0ABS1SLA8_9MICO|nr:hypothetical protein [Leucobacter chromiireducens subsp. chromiireducens]
MVKNDDSSQGNDSAILTSVSSRGIEYAARAVAHYSLDKNGLKSVSLPGSVTRIGAGVLYLNQLTTFDFPQGIETIDFSAFFGNQLEHLTSPE